MSSNVTAADTLSSVILTTFETIQATKSVHVQKENFKQLASYLEKTNFILQELSKLDINDSEVSFKSAINLLSKHISETKTLALECTNRNKIYLLLKSKKIITTLENHTREIGGSLNLVTPLVSLNEISQEVTNLSNVMMDATYLETSKEVEIKEKIESGIRERKVDRSYSNSLLILIADAIGISKEQSVLRKEYEDFKNEMENIEFTEDVGVVQIEQIVCLLGKADIIATAEEIETKYFSKRKSLGRQPLEPLQSFYCPITGDVMEDPVETPSGHSFERSAIEKWLSGENSLCPITKTPLKVSSLRTNKTLRQSIEEWRDRNTMIFIGSMKSSILCDEDEEVIVSLGKLRDLCLVREIHQEWVMMEEYLPVFVSLLSTKNFKIRSLVLIILRILAKDHDDRKESIAEMDDAIKLIVCSLARKIEESKLSLQLLMELSKNDLARNIIGSSQGCILLLVTVTASDDSQAANDAKQLLEKLSFLEQNIVQMAKANYFGPLLHLLSSGSESDQRMMAETLSQLEMTDHGKLMVCESGAVESLISMLLNINIDMKKAAILALEKLSSVPENGLKMIKKNAPKILFEILFRESLSIPSLIEKVVATIMNLAFSLTLLESDHNGDIPFLESEEDVFKLFSLISLNGPNVQHNVLGTFLAVCQSPSGLNIRKTLRKISSVQVLVRLCEQENQTVRTNAVKIFCILTKDGDDDTFEEHVGSKCVETLLKIIKTSENVEEGVAAMEIISNLPRTPQMTQRILDAEALQLIISILFNHSQKPDPMIESASSALCRFTVSTNQELQKQVAESGIIKILVHLLDTGSALTKQNVAVSLQQFSESSKSLSRPIRLKSSYFLSCCFVSVDKSCPVHSGICTIESSLCLLEANAINPLARLLDEPDFGLCEASLDALLTLVNEELLQKGSKVLEGGDVITKMVKLLSSPCVRLQEKALVALERIFRFPEYKQKYKASAQMPLVEITQRGSSGMKSVAAKILAHLNVLHEQSSFF